MESAREKQEELPKETPPSPLETTIDVIRPAETESKEEPEEKEEEEVSSEEEDQREKVQERPVEKEID